MKKPSKESKKRSRHPVADLGLNDIQRMQLKKFYVRCSKANISIRPLTKLLSIIYGSNQVAKGVQAMMQDFALNTPIVMNRKRLNFYVEDGFQEIWKQESTLIDALECFGE